MFDSDGQNQNSSGSATDGPATDTNAPADAATSAPSAPTIPDPMVTPSTQPDPSAATVAETEAGINGVSMENAYIEPAAQIGSAKSTEPESAPTAASMIAAAPNPSALDPDLTQIKQQALQSLGPLVGHLDQAPDEKFKTIMMLIQASDNSKMLREAYDAASQITDEKARAQALLDVVNEINYFAQQAQKQ